jgi:hypothetical protein
MWSPWSAKVTPRKKKPAATKATRPHTGEWRAVFLKTLAIDGNVRAACKAAGVARAVAYRARDEHPDFAAAWDDALADALDLLEQEAWRRAKRLSDTLVIFLLKAHRRELYGDRVRLDVPSLVDQYAASYGELTDEDRARAVAESERLLKDLGRAGR